MEEEIRKEFLELIRLLDEGKIPEFKEKAALCPPVDIAEGLEEITDEGRVLRIFRMLPKDISSDVFSYMTSEQQQLIAESATNAELRELVDDMFLDDTVDFLEEMPANVVKKVLQNTDENTRKTINQFLNYPENSAGSLMTIEYVDLHDYFTVRKAMDYIRRNIDRDLSRAEIAEAIYLNPEYLSRLFKRETGSSLNDYILTEKMRTAQSLLGDTNIPVSLIATKVGYSNFSYFSQVFKKYTGLSPLEYRTAKRRRKL